jgi:hypothetical protein
MTVVPGNWAISGVENELRTRLRGVGLVGELDLDVTSALYALARGNVERFVHTKLPRRQLTKNYPASVVVYLVSQGIYHYDHGGFWNLLDVHGIDPNEYGPAFSEALRDLGLETFSDVKPEGAYRWVTPILLHGGIPRFCAKDVLKLLVEELRRGSGDATEMVSRWVQSPARMMVLDRPVQRFLTHGGAQAVDLVERMIGMVHAAGQGDELEPESLGLPAYLVEAFRSLPADDRSVRHHATSLPAPSIRFDYAAGSGPELVLPIVPAGRGAKSWVVVGEQHQSFNVSQNRAQVVPLPRGASWEVSLASGHGVLRSTVFRGVANTPVLLFDPSSMELLRNQDRITASSVIAVAPPGFTLRHDGPTGLPISEVDSGLPPLDGPWRWYEARHLDLDGVRSIWIGDERAALGLKTASAVVRVASGESRPHLGGTALPHVMTVSGRQVYADVPELIVPGASMVGRDRWQLRVRRGETVGTWSLADLPAAGDHVDLSAVLGEVEAAEIDLDLLGPLGSDLRNVRLAVVPGLDVEAVERVVQPDEVIEVKVRIGADAGAGGKTTQVVRFGPREASAVVQIAGTPPLGLVVTIPRLQWAWRHGRNDLAPLDSQHLVLGVAEVGIEDTLVVRAGLRVKASLELVAAGDTPLQELPWIETVGVDGRWAFPVGSFKDTIKRSERARLRVQVRIDGHAIPLADVVAEYVVSDLTIMSEMVGAAEADLIVRFDENRAFPDRVLRLWSRDRPWAPPFTAKVPDDVDPTDGVELRCEVPPGVYAAEVRIADGWATPVRPRPNHLGVVTTTIGTSFDLRRYRLERGADDPEGCFELALANHAPPTDVSLEQRLDMAPFAVMTLRQLIEQDGARAFESPAYPVVLAVLSEPTALVAGVNRVLVHGGLSDIELQQLLITLAPDVDRSAVEADVVDLHRAHRLHPLLGMLLDPANASDLANGARWMEHLGIDLSSTEEGLSRPAMGAEVGDFWLTFGVDRLRAIELSLDLSDQQPLAGGGFIRAMLQWLRREQANDQTTTAMWVNAHRKLNDSRVGKLSALHHLYLEAVKPQGLGRPAIVRLPYDLLAAAIQLVSIRSSRRSATAALLEASEIAPLLTTRSVLVALYLDRR